MTAKFSTHRSSELASPEKDLPQKSLPVAHAVLSFNHPELTKKCLNSILAKLKSSPHHHSFPHAPVFLLHHGSLGQHRDKLKKAFPQIHHLETSDNKGYSRGANLLLKEVFKSLTANGSNTNSWVFIYTNDTELIELPQDLPKQGGIYAPLLYRRQTQAVDSIGALAEFNPMTRELRLRHCRIQSNFDQAIANFPNLKKNFERKEPSMKQNLFILPYVPGTAFLIDHSSYQSLLQPTFFDESYHTYWEDVDLSLKALSSGIKLSALPTWKLSHGIGKTCHKDRFYTSELFPRNRDKFRQHLEQYLKKFSS